MRIDLDITVRGLDLDKSRYLAVVEQLHHLEKIIMASNTQLTSDIKALTTAVTKIGAETQQILTKVSTLEAALESAGTTPEVDAALADLKSSIETVDALVEDAPTEPTP